MKKLTLKDVKILGEGPQIKKAILEKSKSIKAFHEEYNVEMPYDSFRSYVHRDFINSSTFKYIIVKLLDVDYNDIVLTKPQQIQKYAQIIYDNIWMYDEEEDQKMMNYLVDQCKLHELPTQEGMMYRAKAKNYYYTNRMKRGVEYYEYAMDTLPPYEINRKIFFYCELAYDYVRENMPQTGEKKFRDIQDLVEEHKEKLDKNTLFYYNYWRGITYANIKKNIVARGYFEKALEYAVKNYEKAKAISNIGLTYKKHKNYDEALKKYNEALNYYDEEDILTTASVYNNIAMVYKSIKNYPNAIANVHKALEISEKEYSLGKHLIYVSTKIEIEMDMGNHEAYKEFLSLLLSTKGKHIYSKPYVLNDILSFIEVMDDIHCLYELSDVIIELRDAATSEGYINGLFECLGNVYYKIRKKTEGGCHEKAK